MTTLTADFNGLSMDIIKSDNDFYLTANQISSALEYETPKDSILRIYERNLDLLNDYSTTVKMTAVDGRNREQRVFNEEGVMLIAMKSHQPKAIEFQKWAVRVLKDSRLEHSGMTGTMAGTIRQ